MSLYNIVLYHYFIICILLTLYSYKDIYYYYYYYLLSCEGFCMGMMYMIEGILSMAVLDLYYYYYYHYHYLYLYVCIDDMYCYYDCS